MIKEAKDVDFYTTGRQPSEYDFARISEWIKRDKKKWSSFKKASPGGQRHFAQHGSGQVKAKNLSSSDE